MFDWIADRIDCTLSDHLSTVIHIFLPPPPFNIPYKEYAHGCNWWRRQISTLLLYSRQSHIMDKPTNFSHIAGHCANLLYVFRMYSLGKYSVEELPLLGTSDHSLSKLVVSQKLPPILSIFLFLTTDNPFFSLIWYMNMTLAKEENRTKIISLTFFFRWGLFSTFNFIWILESQLRAF